MRGHEPLTPYMRSFLRVAAAGGGDFGQNGNGEFAGVRTCKESRWSVMSLELLNTLASLATVVIVATAAIAALVQLRHLRSGNQISAILAIGEQFQSQDFRDATFIVRSKLAHAMESPLFREYAACFVDTRPVPSVGQDDIEVRRAAILIGNAYEHVGILIKHGVVGGDIFLDRYSGTIIRMWDLLATFIAFMRDAAGGSELFENFELLVVYAKRWEREHANSYPKGTPRLVLRNPWPVAPRSDAANVPTPPEK